MHFLDVPVWKIVVCVSVNPEIALLLLHRLSIFTSVKEQDFTLETVDVAEMGLVY